MLVRTHRDWIIEAMLVEITLGDVLKRFNEECLPEGEKEVVYNSFIRWIRKYKFNEELMGRIHQVEQPEHLVSLEGPQMTVEGLPAEPPVTDNEAYLNTLPLHERELTYEQAKYVQSTEGGKLKLMYLEKLHGKDVAYGKTVPLTMERNRYLSEIMSIIHKKRKR